MLSDDLSNIATALEAMADRGGASPMTIKMAAYMVRCRASDAKAMEENSIPLDRMPERVTELGPNVVLVDFRSQPTGPGGGTAA